MASNFVLQEKSLDGWEAHAAGDWLVIPTNCFVKANGSNVMGAGLAKQAVARYRGLPAKYGASLLGKIRPGRPVGEPVEAADIETANRIVVAYSSDRLVCAPVKYNWWQEADTELIARSMAELVELASVYPEMRLAVPRLGCGNGKRDWETEVKPLVQAALSAAAPDVAARFVLLSPPA